MWISATFKGIQEQSYSRCASWHTHHPAYTDAFSQLRNSLHVWVPYDLGGLLGTDLRLHCARKTNLVPKSASERPGRSCLLVPQSKVFWRIVANRERASLMTRLVLLLVTLRTHLLKEFSSSSFSSSSHTRFQHTVQPDIFLLLKSSFFQVTTLIWAVLHAGQCLLILLLNYSIHNYIP